MARETTSKTSSGVQELISRLRDEGVQAGSQEAERLLAQARREAAEVLQQAHSEAARLREQTHLDIEKERESATHALKLASRDTVLELREAVSRHFEQHVKRLVSQVTIDTELLKSMILILAGHAASEFVRDREAEVLVAHFMLGASEDDEDENLRAEQRAHKLVLGITGDMLRDGVELIPDTDISGGARVRVKGQDVEIDLSDEAVTELLMKHLLPRFQTILSGAQ